MANTSNSDKWYFTKEQLETTPSRLCGFDAYKELQYRQQAANFIQDMGQRLKVSQLCINTAIVYMHRFYVFHSFTDFPWYQMAAAALFLAAKVEEQPRKLEYVIRVANICKNPRDSAFDINSERYIAQSQDLVFNENVLLQTLGFDVAIDHPHTYVVRCCHLVRASKDLAQTSYFMASNSLHLTTMCIQYKPTVVACFCILLACKWSNWEIPLSNESKEWFTYVDQSVTAELLEQLTSEFLVIFENCPSRLKEKIMTKQDNFSSPGDQDKKQDGSSRSLEYKGDDPHKHRQGRPHEASSSGHRTQEQKEREYKERKEKERIAHMSGITLPHQPHHHRTIDQKVKPHARPPSNPCFPPGRNEPRDILREASKEPSFGIPAVLHDPSRDHGKETNLPGRSDKEVSKRDPLLKPNVQTDMNSLNNYTDIRQRTDPNRPRMDPKTASKQELLRRYEEQKAPHVRSDADNIKKHLSSSYDKNSAYLKSTSQKIKSPFNLDNKSVPKTTTTPVSVPIAKPHYNGNTNGSYNKTISHHDHELNKSKTEVPPVKEDEIPTPAFIKRPSLFSPEKTPPQHKSEKSESLTNIPITNLTALSPINSPSSVQSNRNRNYSSSSEPELRPTMKKIDQVEGFETLMRDNTIGVGSMHSVADSAPGRAEENLINQPQATSELKRTSSPTKDAPNLQSVIVNGLETNPTIISNLLKEAATNSHLPSMAPAPAKPTEPVEPSSVAVPPPEHKDKEHHHHKSKKKKEKHKHKDKSKEEKEKKKKHKDKDKEKHKHKDRKEVELPVPVVSEPIKIKIQKDKIQPLNELKIKIPKDKIITDGMMDPLPQPSSGGLKIKIPKEVITNCGTSSGSSLSNSVDLSVSGSNRKRERERVSPKDNPPLKQTKFHHKDSKQNGRPSYNKVSENNNHSNEYLDNYALIDSSETSLVKDQTLKIVSPLNDNNNSQFFPSKTPALCDNVSKAQNSAACSDDTNKRTSESTQKVSQVSKLYADSTNESDHKTLPAAKSNTPQTNQAPYKYNNNNSFKGNNTSFQKHNGFEEYSMPYHSKGNRPNFNQQPPRYPRHPQLRHPPPGGPKLYRPPPNQNHLPQSYTAPPPMPFSSYVIPPPMIPNINVPPPPYMYQPFYHSYNVYPDIYQQPNLLVGLNPPPLPPEAPPNDIPPPPPPDEA